MIEKFCSLFIGKISLLFFFPFLQKKLLTLYPSYFIRRIIKNLLSVGYIYNNSKFLKVIQYIRVYKVYKREKRHEKGRVRDLYISFSAPSYSHFHPCFCLCPHLYQGNLSLFWEGWNNDPISLIELSSQTTNINQSNF